MGFDHELYANACVSMAVRHKQDSYWDAMPGNVYGAWVHGEEDHVNELFNRIGLTKLSNEFIDYINSCESLDEKGKMAAMTYVGIILDQDISSEDVIWSTLADTIGWQPGGIEHVTEYIELERMFSKMDV